MNLTTIGIYVTRFILTMLVVIPTLISIYVLSQVKALDEKVSTMEDTSPRLVCLTTENCAIEINGKWYSISGVIDMESTIPPEYQWMGDSTPAIK
jgi:hypothetical protein